MGRQCKRWHKFWLRRPRPTNRGAVARSEQQVFKCSARVACPPSLDHSDARHHQMRHHHHFGISGCGLTSGKVHNYNSIGSAGAKGSSPTLFSRQIEVDGGSRSSPRWELWATTNLSIRSRFDHEPDCTNRETTQYRQNETEFYIRCESSGTRSSLERFSTCM
jgi:hypothetical protein